jgi:NTP pyrophosphatase (non-canonical NTP hydrolase)
MAKINKTLSEGPTFRVTDGSVDPNDFSGYIKLLHLLPGELNDMLDYAPQQAELWYLYLKVGALVSEASEALDVIKKHLEQNKPFDDVKFHEELGDTLHYLLLVVGLSGTTIDELMRSNVTKLEKRLEEGYFPTLNQA